MKMRGFGRGPFSDIIALQDQVERLFRESRTRQRRAAAPEIWQPALDMAQSAEAYYVRFDLAGTAKADIQLSVQEGELVLRGTKASPELPGGKVVRRERAFGPFGRTVPLPSDADDGDIAASFTHGILEVRIGRRGRKQPRVIEIAQS